MQRYMYIFAHNEYLFNYFSIMWGMIAAAAVSAAAGIAGGIKKTANARKLAKEQQHMLDKERGENAAWYQRRYYEDPLERVENRSALEQARKNLIQSSKAAAGVASVTGASNAAQAAQKEANNEAYTGLVQGIAANAGKSRDAVESSYRKANNEFDKGQIQLNASRAEAQNQAVDTAVEGVQNAASIAAKASVNKPGSSNQGIDWSKLFN